MENMLQSENLTYITKLVIIANRWGIFSTLTVTNMLIKIPHSVDAYCGEYLVDTILESDEVTGENRHEDTVTDSLHLLQTQRSGHSVTTLAKSVRDNFKEYFMIVEILLRNSCGIVKF